MAENLKGLIAATHTPFTPSGELAIDLVAAQVEVLAGLGMQGLLCGGTTGEFASLTLAERMALCEASRKACPAELKLLAHTGSCSLAEARELTAHAAATGVDAISLAPPFYYKIPDADSLLDFCAEVAAAAPKLPFYYYHIPSLTGVNLPMCDFLGKAVERIPNLAGVKYTHHSLDDFLACRHRLADRLDLIFGRDEMLLSALPSGIEAAIGSTYNVAAPLYLALWKAFEEGRMEEALQWQGRALAMMKIRKRYGSLVAEKAMMRLHGLDLGPVRLPLKTIEQDASEAMLAELKALGLEGWMEEARERA